MRKNVLQLVGSFHQGGSERQAVQLTRLVYEDGSYNVRIATLNNEGVLKNEINETLVANIAEFPLTSFFNLHFVRQLRKCARFLRENKIEIVHTHDFYTNVFGILAATIARVPLRIASKRETKGVRSKGQELIERLIFRFADRIVVNSEAVSTYLVGNGVSREKVKLVYNGVDPDRFKPMEDKLAVIRNELDLPKDDEIKIITLVANLRHEVKNQEMLLRAAKIMRKDFPEVHFVFAGEGERKGEMEEMASKFGISATTHFIGKCENVAELLCISYACVLTSYAEGFSNSILEYMLASKPVVATNVGGAGEAIDNGRSGFLVEFNDDQGLAKCLGIILNDEEKAKSFGAVGREIVRRKFSLQEQLMNTLRLYRT